MVKGGSNRLGVGDQKGMPHPGRGWAGEGLSPQSSFWWCQCKGASQPVDSRGEVGFVVLCGGTEGHGSQAL